MKLSTQRKKQTGAFYTPKIWADLAVEYMQHFLPLPLEEYFFYDPAGGEGALLEALPENCQKLATTLEREDVFILRNKNICAYRFDFLNDEIWAVKERLQPYIDSKRLVIFMNPPYVKLPAEPKTYAGKIYGTNDSVALFYYRCAFELSPAFICSFNKLDLLQAPKMADFRHFFVTGRPLLKFFITDSKSWGLKGGFPIGFMMWSCQMDRRQYAEAMSQKKYPPHYDPRPSLVWEKSFTSDEYALASKEQKAIFDREIQAIKQADKEWRKRNNK